MTDGNDLAYPVADYAANGLTKRELFAAMAMQGILTSSNPFVMQMDDMDKSFYSVRMADNLIKELNKT